MSQGAGNDGQEKTLDATPARLERARKEGDVPQSKEANAAASYLGFFLAFILFSGAASMAILHNLFVFLERPESLTPVLSGGGPDLIFELSRHVGVAAAPFLLFPAIAVIASVIGQRALTVTPSRIKPKLKNISIPSNFKKKFGPDGLVEFGKSFAKLVFIFFFFAVLFIQQLPTLPTRSLLPVTATPPALLENGVIFFAVIVIFSTVIAGVDLPWTHYQYAKRNRMSFEELKKELKESDGDPALKQNRRQRAQEIATNRMLQDVPDATVVVVNPLHYAVALTWEREKLCAPVCVAKGVDEIAARIREVAAENGVPIHRDPPTARAIHASVDIGEEIDREQYEAVAAAIRFADTIRQKARQR
ncbi:MAG: flagellar type III secretion system protein FlhB [Pseudomonadota bacterium]